MRKFLFFHAQRGLGGGAKKRTRIRDVLAGQVGPLGRSAGSHVHAGLPVLRT